MMRRDREPAIPPLAEKVLALLVPDPAALEGLLGDLEEEAEQGRLRLWLRIAGIAASYGRARLLDIATRRRPSGPGGRHTRGGSGIMDWFGNDIRLAVRSLLRAPGFLAVVVLTLALGIGANSAIFSVVDGVLLRPLPYPEPDRIVLLGHASTRGEYAFSVHTPGNFSDWRARSTSFDAMAAFSTASMTWTAEGRSAERISGVVSVGSVFDVLAVAPRLGRAFQSSDDQPGPERIVVLSHGLSVQAFGDENPVGRSITLGGEPYRITAVMPEDFSFPDPRFRFWIPSGYDTEVLANRTEYFLRTVARLAPGVTIAQAREEMEGIAADLRREFPVANEEVTVAVAGLHDLTVADTRTLLRVLMGAVGMVLLIACINVANLLLSRTTGQEADMAVRRALGAGTGQIVRHQLAQSLVLTAAGAVAGLAAGWAFLQGLLAWIPGGLPRTDAVHMDGRTLAFTAAAALLSAVVFSALPVLRLLREDPRDRMGTRSGRGAGTRLSGLLLSGEIALAVVLLVGTSLLTRSFLGMLAVDPGFQTENRLTARVSLAADATVDERVAFFDRLKGRLEEHVGVGAVGFTSGLPATGVGSAAWLNVMDRPPREGGTPDGVHYRVTDESYLPLMGIPLLRGRLYDAGDGLSGTPSVVISQRMAELHWPGEDPLGKQITLGPDGGWIPPSTIVGVVGDVRMFGLDEEVPPTVYAPHQLMPWTGSFQLVVHSEAPPADVTALIREQLGQLDPDLPVFDVALLEDILSTSAATRRNAMALMGLLSSLALFMASAGLFGVVSYRVARRTREFGIRIAVGADASDILAAVLRWGVAPVASGVAVGLLLAVALSRTLSSMLFEVSAADPTTLVLVPLLLAAVAAVAMAVPAFRACRVDPVTALAAE